MHSSRIAWPCALLIAAACGSDVTNTSTGTTGSPSVTSGPSTTTGQGGGSGGSTGPGTVAGGSGGIPGTGGAGGSGQPFACGNMGLMCTSPQICVTFVVTQGPTTTITYECRPDPCAPQPLACNCAMSICPGGMMGACTVTAPDQLTCSSGGVCASPDTPIATPDGERAISELREGEQVYSMHQGRLQAVPILRAQKTRVHQHHVVEVTLEGGATLRISALHPTADGRLFGDLLPGATLDGHRVLGVATLPYEHGYTHDILPASDSGSYLAGGALIGSTLRR